MTNHSDFWASFVFIVFFALTILIGSSIQQIRALFGNRVATNNSLEEWGLGGRHFGPWITWFLIGGDFYTAYTVIALPALVYAKGAFGFFAMPYTIIVYPFIFFVMPKLWQIARDNGYSTAADIVRARFNSRSLEVIVAITGIAAVIPYMALQLVGIRDVVETLGLPAEASLIIAFLALAAYTWLGGLHAPALTAFIKDVMIYITVLVAVTLIPLHIHGGYTALFPSTANTHTVLKTGQALPFATLALSSALAAFLYPHTFTGVLASRSADTIRQNAVFLPIYTILLGLISMLGFMAHAVGINTPKHGLIVPLLFLKVFPSWFAGFCLASVAVGALIPAAVMAIGAANLVTQNILPPIKNQATMIRTTKLAAFLTKLGALLCILCLTTKFALNFQLLGCVVILQTFPAVIMGLMHLRLSKEAILSGWIIGSVIGVGLTLADGLKPFHFLHLGIISGNISTALFSMVLNCIIVLLISWIRPGHLPENKNPHPHIQEETTSFPLAEPYM